MNRSTWTGVAAVAAGAWAFKRILRELRHMSFRNRVALITGGSRGLGLVLARQLAAEGARLVLLARDGEELQRAVADVAARGAEVLGVPCDVRSQDAVDSAVKRVIDRFGRIDLLINNAGTITVGPVDHMSMEDFNDALAMHLYAPLYAMLAAIPQMRVQGEGRIVNISSIGGKVGVPHLAPYCASKFALVGLSEAIRAELAEDNIHVTAVCPGLMRTGSPNNALFKGRNTEEYTWFALMDANPLLSISAERAARKIVNAARHGDAQLVISMQAKLAVVANNLMPEFSARLMALMSRLLPGVSMIHEQESFTGWQSRSRLAPSALTSLSEKAALRNNEFPPARAVHDQARKTQEESFTS